MTTYNFADLLNEAKSSGAMSDPPPDGTYTLEVKGANTGKTKRDHPRFGIRFVVVDGPEKDKSFWHNLQLVADSPQNLAMTFDEFARLGIPQDFWASNPSDEAVKERILGIGTLNAQVSSKQNGQYTNWKLRNIRLLSGGAAQEPAPAPAAPATLPSF